MEHLGFGLWMTVLGMGSVFLLLLMLMLLLLAIGWLDKRSVKAAALADQPEEQSLGEEISIAPEVLAGLSDKQIAAISVAVFAHQRLRRLQAAPVMRSYEPGSQLFASRWVAIGRGYQHQPYRRGN
ncbi:MAG: OadG family protein [Propionibacteriaceae bacterium]|jgi:sodium pump decarboxylase gamma subunit|nr:OadG family protein [Propionibacteriaceae bacterium]